MMLVSLVACEKYTWLQASRNCVARWEESRRARQVEKHVKKLITVITGNN